jgi:hypothetical protein
VLKGNRGMETRKYEILEKMLWFCGCWMRGLFSVEVSFSYTPCLPPGLTISRI